MNKLIFTSLALCLTLSAHARQKAIYGSFGNQFITQQTNQKIKEAATGVAYVTDKANLSKGANDTTTVRGARLKDMANLCSKESFSNNIAAADNCTAFLIAPDLVMTAGHCMKSIQDCQSNSFIFGVNSAKEIRNGFSINTSNVYQCKSIVTNTYDSLNDIAVVKLNRKVEYRHIFTLGTDAEVRKKSSVFMMGHPLGLALTYTSSAPVTHLDLATKFRSTLDSFGGNSGSPVIDTKTLKVLGVLVSGKEDFTEQTSNKCKNYARYKDSDTGELIQRVEETKEFLVNHRYIE